MSSTFSLSALAAVILTCVMLGGARAQDAPTPPEAPRQLQATAAGTTVKLSWRASDGAADYTVERAPAAGDAFAPLGTTAETAFEDATVTAGESYRYRVSARSAAGLVSEPTRPLPVLTLRAPEDLQATLAVVDEASGAVRAEVSWKDASGGEAEQFRIERRPLGAGEFVKLDDRKKSRDEKRTPPERYTYTDAAVDPGSRYEYRVVATKDTTDSAPSAPAVTPPLAPPAAPTDLAAGAFVTDRIDLRWRDASRNESGFRVERRAVGAEGWEALASLGPDVTSYSDPVTPGAAYEYRVVAFNEAGEAPGADAVGARTPTRGPVAPGAVGASGLHRGPTAVPDTTAVRPAPYRQHFSPLPDRWRIEMPQWDRYPGPFPPPQEQPYERGSIWDPYHQNVLKGDYPVLGNDIFLFLELQSDTLAEGRRFPIPSGVSTEDPRSAGFFGDFDQFLFAQNFVISAELFQGDTAFRPKDAAIKVTAVANLTYLDAFENNIVNIDPREGHDRLDGHVGIQELLIDKHLVDLGPNYDFITLIAGIQRFQSDFRGFVYSDNNLGVRLQGNHGSNRLQWNLAYFSQLEKDTNSGLNDYELRDQHVLIANLYLQDALQELGDGLVGRPVLGYTAHLSYHLNLDRADVRYDDNNFLVRPSRIGFASGAVGGPRTKEVTAHYLGWGGEGHIGRLNLSHQYYLALGEESWSEIANREQDITAHLVAVEASVDVDWLRLKSSYMWASGDRDPDDDEATGFSSIIDNPFFAGAGFSYFNRQNVPLVQTGVQLTQRLSLLTDMRSSKIEGTSNFVNPGLHLANVGMSARVLPELFLDFNVNFLWFDRTEVLEKVLVQDRIGRSIGVDYNLGVQYRPLLTDNVIITTGVGVLVPGRGFRNIYDAQTLYSGFVALTLTY